MSGKDFGGKITVSSSRGYKLSLCGTLAVKGAHQSNDKVTNQDGSVDRLITPDAPSADLSFRDDGHDADMMLNGDRENITIVEEKTGVTHLFTDAFWTGKPNSNRINGEMTELTIAASYYRRARLMGDKVVNLTRRYEAHGKTFDSVTLRAPKLRDYLVVGEPVEVQPSGDGGRMVIE
jgi:Phage tail tube protein